MKAKYTEPVIEVIGLEGMLLLDASTLIIGDEEVNDPEEIQ